MENKIITLELQDQRVLLTSQLAKSYGTSSRRISENFLTNKSHYVEGKHYFCLTGQAKHDFLNHTEFPYGSLKKASAIYLWTQRGALLHAKSLNTDKAWEVYGELVESYFMAHEKPAPELKPMTALELIAAQAKASIELENRVNTIQKTADSANEAAQRALKIATQQHSNWTSSTDTRIRKIAKLTGRSPLAFYVEIYKEIQKLQKVNLNKRVANAKIRLKKSGATWEQQNRTTKLSIIGDDPKLRESLESILNSYLQ